MRPTRRRPLEPPPSQSIMMARKREMRRRLSASSLVLGGDGRETRDWSLSNTQPWPQSSSEMDLAQREKNVKMKQALMTAQIVLGEDVPEWGSSNAMPQPDRDVSRYRGQLSAKTARFMKTSSFKMGSSSATSEYKTSLAREGFRTPEYSASLETFRCNKALHDELQTAGRTTRIIDPDGDAKETYESSNAMPDLTDRLGEAKLSPSMSRERIRRTRKSNVQLGDDRIKTLTTTQHDSMDEIVEATRSMESGFNARSKQDPRVSTLELGNGTTEHQWRTSNAMPNWYAPETYDRAASPLY